MKRRTRLQRTASLSRRTPLPPPRRGLARRVGLAPMSTKRQGERQARRDAVETVAARDGLRCFAQRVLEHRCGGPLDAHEVIPRSAWPGGHLVPGNIRLVCRSAHEWIGTHPARAHDLGLHGYSYERPEEAA